MCAEAFTTMTFGIRFSNLTYRGLMSTGLFRYTKHPQYVSKMLNRFLVFVPFLSLAGFAGAVWTMLLFAALCLLYYVRARTEENHLSIHEDYALYASLMNERSVFAPLARLAPFLRYSREKAFCGRLF
jgi:protein-S-isoprenylcysteine O-methyltransferase Ste14